MSTTSRTPTEAEVEAGRWVMTLNQRLVSLDQRHAFETWLNDDPEHARAYERAKEVWQIADSCGDLLDEARAEVAAAEQSRRTRLRHAATMAGVVLSIGVLALGAWKLWWPGSAGRFETATAQIQKVYLDDGTQVTLGAASKIAVDFAPRVRQVRLIRGEAFFEVAHDAGRPFLVIAGDAVVRVLGTKFDVHYGEQAVRVGVVEGRVEVMHAAELTVTAPAVTAQSVSHPFLTAGGTAVVEKAGAILTSTQSNHEDLGGWRRGRLVYVDARLRDVVSDMNRYVDGEIEIADEKLGDQQLTIAFRANEIDQGITLIEGTLPVRAVRSAAGKILLTQR